MVCQKKQFLRKIISQPLCKNANFSAKQLRGLTRETAEYKGLQEVTRGYKRLQGIEGIGGEREIWKRIGQKST